MEIKFTPIGILTTPFDDLTNMPIQPSGKQSAPGFASVFDEYIDGLQGLEDFSHVILIYFFHQQQKTLLKVKPFLEDTEMGIFSTRAPARPNKIGISIVPLQKIEGCRIYLKNLDMLNGTPLLDVKPYVPKFDQFPDANNGWLEGNSNTSTRLSDDRFAGL
jgi:tRNA (adenine37-N6)-methyltransferase